MEAEKKYDRLVKLREEWEECTRCTLATPTGRARRNVVFGYGNHDAKLMIIGEAPGEVEDSYGEIFLGPAGELLDQFLSAFNSSREDVYMTHLVMCRPTEEDDSSRNRKPTKEELLACSPRIHREIETVDPICILLLGDTALKTLAHSKSSITAVARNPGIPRLEVVSKGIFGPVIRPAFATFHPAYLLKAEPAEIARRKGSDTHKSYETWKKAFEYVDRAMHLYHGTPIPVREA